MVYSRKTLFVVLTLFLSFTLSLLASSKISALYTRQQLDNMLQGGSDQAVQIDRECRNNLLNGGGASKKFNRSGGGQLRNHINSGDASYVTLSWMSERGRGNTSIPILVSYGDVNVDLQINFLKMLCGSLVKPRTNDNTNYLAYTGQFIANQRTRWVGNEGYYDNIPRRHGSAYDWPAWSAENTYITDSWADGGSLVPSPSYKTMQTRRDENSRYWFSNAIPTTYRSNEPITSDRTINVYYGHKGVTQYQPGVYRCLYGPVTPGVHPRSMTDYDRCVRGQNQLSFRVRVLQVNPWSLTGESYIGTSSVEGASSRRINNIAPGTRVFWKHGLHNTSAHPTNTIINYRVSNSGYAHGSPNGSPPNLPNGQIPRINSKSWWYANGNSYLVQQNDVGKLLCQNISFNPSNGNNTRFWGNGASYAACADVPYNYSLTPVINVSSDAIAEGASLVSGINASIRNSGPTVSDKANYSVIRFVVRGDQDTNIAGGDDVLVPRNPSAPGNLISDWPCEVARQIGSRTGLNIDSDNCLGGGLPSKGSGTVISLSGLPISVPDNDVSDLNLAVGDRLCYTTIVSTYGAKIGRDRFRYAAPKCLVVAKKPKVQFWGGDVRAGKEVITSLSHRGAAYYGSWAEYALFSATTSVDATSSSGAGLSATVAGRDIAGGPISYNRITFGNTPIYGGFNASQSVIPSIFLASGTNITASNVDVNALPSGVNTRSGNLTLRASTLAPGKRIFIRATGTVTIDGNINYATGPFASLSDMPQLAIIAQNIIINPDVTELNGWLIARESNPSSSNGYVSTCGPVSNPASYTNGLKSTVCDKPLKINGPIIANHLYLRRTAGAEKEHPGIPAEILNLRPDVYLSYFGSSRNSGAIKTSYLREMPPRF